MNRRIASIWTVLLFLRGHATPARAGDPVDLSDAYRITVDRALNVASDELPLYYLLAEAALLKAKADLSLPQHMLVVDRSPWVQAALVLWRSEFGEYRFVGASPVSTGRPGAFDHFETPLGVFAHSPANMDFRAKGTYNKHGIRGYGVKGLRVYDFGWQRSARGWGNRALGEMRLQMHATEPDSLEHRLGSAQSRGCIRIPATLNLLLDRYGVLDAEYERLQNDGKNLWVLRADRQTVANPGRYLVVIESLRTERAVWSPAPSVTRAQ